MNRLNISSYTLSICVAVIFLAGCSGSQIPIGVTRSQHNARPLLHGVTVKVIYSFQDGSDGALPVPGAAPLTVMNGLLYGTTGVGGGSGCGGSGCGTVFEASPSGTESVLYSFQGKPDGQGPSGSPINVNGNFYGVTASGGANSDGAIYELDTSSHEQVIYSFKGGSTDGSSPFGQLLAFNGLLYGTTRYGGSRGLGTVFTVTPSGSERTLYNFKHDGDGANPYAGLTPLNGTLYGTTAGGGTYSAGTVFAISTSGNERVIYNFKYGTDGASPEAPLISIGNELYGTTASGGGQGYLGTVFKVSTSGSGSILHRFARNVNDGISPLSSLKDFNGTLYGTTSLGGRKANGIVFSLTMSGKESVLHYFQGAPDGMYPTGGLAAISNALYATTSEGGTGPCYYHRLGCGTIFKFAP